MDEYTRTGQKRVNEPVGRFSCFVGADDAKMRVEWRTTRVRPCHRDRDVASRVR